ncbi:MAG: YitT family protein [Ginsengibacter sp.]
MQFDKAYSFVIKKLEDELPKYLTYHSTAHTTEVISHVEELAAAAGITGNDLILVETAALLHDAGYLETYTGHEEISCRMAEKWLPDFSYTKEEIDEVCTLIMSTSMPLQPKTMLAEILCDANLYYIGTDTYLLKAEKLYKERAEAGLVKDRDQWKNIEIKFLQTHKFFTPEAKKQLGPVLKKNEEALREKEFGYKKKATGFLTFDWITELILMIAGVAFASFALKALLVPNDFFDGGITGISLLIHHIYHFNLGYVIVLANLPFIVMCIFAVNFKYALKTFFCVVMLGLCLLYLDYPQITSDKLLVSIFGGFFLGIGIGLTMRAGCAIDGIEVLALYTWRRTSFTISEIILAINIVIFSIAAFKFGIDTAFYSMLTYFTATKTIDYVVEGLEAYIGVTIISGKSEMVKDRLVNEMGRGITIYKGERGYLPGKFETHQDVDIIFTVVTRLELRKLKNLVHEIDSRAFVFASMIREASGGIIKRRHLH